MKAHVCVGGPLDGLHAASIDFYGRWEDCAREEGMYAHLRNDYAQFNTAARAATHRSGCHVVWLHSSFWKPPVTMRNR